MSCDKLMHVTLRLEGSLASENATQGECAAPLPALDRYGCEPQSETGDFGAAREPSEPGVRVLRLLQFGSTLPGSFRIDSSRT